MVSNYDLIIIGSGAAATTAAYIALEKDLKIGIVDQKPIGGTCALRGCDPKKVIFGVTEALASLRRLQGQGIEEFSGRIDWRELIEFKNTFTEPMSKKTENGLTSSGIDVFHGRANFVSPDEIEVGNKRLQWKKLLIASGAKAASLDFPGSEHLVDNEGFMNLLSLPRRIVFIGGGYISVEFAGIASSAGADVTIIQHSPGILVNFDSDMAGIVSENLSNSGVKIITNASVKSVVKTKELFSVRYAKNGEEKEIIADLVVHGAGREFDSDMGLDTGNVRWSRRGILVNEYLQSISNPNVYAAGDSADTTGSKLTPVANLEGEVAAVNLTAGNSRNPEYRGIPTTVFSSPPLAMVGITEEKAIDLGLDIKVNKGEMSSWYNSRRRMLARTFYKIIMEKETGKILGAHVLGQNSEEVINIFALAIRFNLNAKQIASIPYTYPSDSNDVRYMLG